LCTDLYEDFIGPQIRENYDFIWLGPFLCSIISKPEDVRIVLNCENSFEKSSVYKITFKTGLSTIGGKKYKQHRKSLNPIFKPSHLRSFLSVIDLKTQHFFNVYSNELEIDNDHNDVKFLISKYTLSTVCSSIFGIDESDKKLLNKVIENTETYVQNSIENAFKPWKYFDFIFEFSKQKYLNTIEELLKNVKNDENLISYFSCMKDFNNEMSKDEFLESIAVFLFASYETTSQTIANILLLLSMNQNEQEKLFNEISTIINSPDEEVTEEKLNQMSYLEFVIKETLRLFPTLYFLFRKASDDIKLSMEI
jgi:cytochrome P450